ncbi:hypothetical protein G6F43_003181 [Rhizopus delemar]|nr:hypothetical protein G6F43_003181 [Rhizopus delemar]
MELMTGQHYWLDPCKLLSLPKEILLEIITYVTFEKTLYPTSLLELSSCCKYLHHLVHKDPWRLQTIWPQVFHSRFDTRAIYRRRLHTCINWQSTFERRCKALYNCRSFALNKNDISLLDTIDWEVIWDMLTEHDQINVAHLFNFQVPSTAGLLFQLGRFRDREAYPIVLPILSLLVNYDFTITRFFTTNTTSSLVSSEISQFAYHSESDSLITKHTPFRYNPEAMRPKRFYPAQDPLAAAFHLFFTTIFAAHPNLYQAIPGCIPIPLFHLQSEQFDVEYLRRYERHLFFSTPAINLYASSGLASPDRFVSEAHLIEGDWMGYYTFQDTDDTIDLEDWFDGPMRITLKIVPLDHGSCESAVSSSRQTEFPSSHLRSCPLTRFEGTGMDSSGSFLVSGLIDDSEEGQITWEKNYIESGETWEYSGRFLWPVGLCGRWGDEEYGGPWWMWKVEASLPTISSTAK